MPKRTYQKRTLLAASFFYVWLLPALATAGCPSGQYVETVNIKQVIDGDTVHLNDGRHVRFIGINTPERANETRTGEPLADKAQQRLTTLIGSDRQLLLQHDSDRRDRYGRQLAHPFLADGRNLTELMLEEGWGFHIAVPSNLVNVDCYYDAERRAREAKRGVWGQAYFQPRQAADLTRNDTGFRRVTGTVIRVGESRTAIWLNLGRVSRDGTRPRLNDTSNPGFALRIPKSALMYFTSSPVNLAGKNITVKGWVYFRNNELRMTLQHPAMIEHIASQAD